MGRLQTLPDEAHHRNVDKIVQAAAAADPSAVRVAIVCPPTIYGVGSGSVSTRSVQAPDLVATTLARGTAPIVGPPGLTEWDNVHIDDLADLYVRLAEATQDPALQGNPEVFGIDGYFFAGTGVHTWADLARWAADQAHKDGYLAEAKTEYVSIAQVASGSPTAPSWGRNSKGVARRAARVLGWAPGGKASIETEVRELVEREAKANGVKKV